MPHTKLRINRTRFLRTIDEMAQIGLLADAGVRYEAYNTRYVPGDSGIPATTSRDSFFSLLLSIGYAY